MLDRSSSRLFRILAGYYGVLQSLHLISLARAGGYMLKGRGIPFPAPPPPGDWPQAALPFLVGMGIVDVFAIGLGLVFVYLLLFKDRTHLPLGLISLTTAVSSGIIYLVGTLPSGAWEANPWDYLVVILFFSPVLIFYTLLIKANFRTG